MRFALALTVVLVVCLVACRPAEEPVIAPQLPVSAASASASAPVEDAAPPPAVVKAPSAPKFVFHDVSLDSLRGKVVVLHFFASWCEPCKVSLPALAALGTKHAGSLYVVAVSEDDDFADAKQFFSHVVRPRAGAPAGIETMALDDNKTLAGAYKISTMPYTVVIDREGRIAFRHAGYHDGEDAEIEREVGDLLAR